MRTVKFAVGVRVKATLSGVVRQGVITHRHPPGPANPITGTRRQLVTVEFDPLPRVFDFNVPSTLLADEADLQLVRKTTKKKA